MNNPKFTFEELRARACMRASRVIFGMWEESGCSDTRLLEQPLIPDELVLAGESLEVAKDRAQLTPLRVHREHVVPRLVICVECHRIFEDGVKNGIGEEGLVRQAALAIKKHLRIVTISKNEQKKLDGLPGLKMGMPDGWTSETGDPYARLHAAEIDFKLYEPTSA